MAVTIHASAVVHPQAKLGQDVTIGPGAIVSEYAQIGDRTTIGAHALVDSWTTVGSDCRVFTGAILGSECQDLKFKGDRSYLKIGNKNIIREYVTMNRATGEDASTVVGDQNLFMAYSHVGHDSLIGNTNIIANAVTLAGHVTIESNTNIGGLSAIHQYVRIGSYSMIGGYSRIVKDIPPYILCAGSPLRIVGINRIGLERKGFSNDRIKIIEHAYRIMYRSKLNVTQALKKLEEENTQADVAPFIDFIRTSERGIAK